MRRLSSCLHRGRGRSSEAKDPNHPDVETKGLNGDIDFKFRVEHRHSNDTGQTRCRTRSHHLSFLPKERKRENHPATSNCKNLPRRRKMLYLNSPPFRSHAGYYSESRHFCAVVVADGGRHLSRRGSSRGKRRQTGSRASSGRVIIIQSGGRDLIWDILLSPFFPIPFQRPLSSSLISDNSSKRVSEPGTEKDRVMMKTTGGRRSPRLRAREWSGVGTSTWTPKMVNDSDRFAVKEEEVGRWWRPRATKG